MGRGKKRKEEEKEGNGSILPSVQCAVFCVPCSVFLDVKGRYSEDCKLDNA